MKQELESKAAATIEMAMEYAVVELLMVGELEKSSMRMRMTRRMLMMMMMTTTMMMMTTMTTKW